ncbi:MAG: RNA polymerase sigma factor [Rhodanobacter sp.]
MNPDKHTFWARMFVTHQGALSSFFRRRVADPWDVQDLAQEVYVRLLRGDGDAASSIDNPEAYLFTVASNLVKEHAVRQKRRAFSVDITKVLPELEAPSGSAEDETAREYRRQQVTEMLDRLPPRCKAVMVMQYREGMSYEEIAVQLGVSIHMIKKYVVKALSLCRRGLDKYQ